MSLSSGEALCVRWCMGKEAQCQGVNKKGDKEFCVWGGGPLAHR